MGDVRLRMATRRVDDAVALALEQPGCPVALQVLAMTHDEQGSTVKIRVDNHGRDPVTRFSITAWVLMPDGTLRGTQQFDRRQTLEVGEPRTQDLHIRTVRVSPADTVVAAVVETHGDAWKGDAAALMAEAKAVIR
jgi:hypothetical protein